MRSTRGSRAVASPASTSTATAGSTLHDYVLTHVAFGLDPPLQEVVDRFRHFDFNGDGVITFDEYLANYRRHQFSDDVMPFYFCAD